MPNQTACAQVILSNKTASVLFQFLLIGAQSDKAVCWIMKKWRHSDEIAPFWLKSWSGKWMTLLAPGIKMFSFWYTKMQVSTLTISRQVWMTRDWCTWIQPGDKLHWWQIFFRCKPAKHLNQCSTSRQLINKLNDGIQSLSMTRTTASTQTHFQSRQPRWAASSLMWNKQRLTVKPPWSYHEQGK